MEPYKLERRHQQQHHQRCLSKGASKVSVIGNEDIDMISPSQGDASNQPNESDPLLSNFLLEKNIYRS